MKITSIRVTHVNVPFDAPFWWTAGLYPGASKSIVEVETDDGIVGLGEAPWFRRQIGDVVDGGPIRQTDNTIRVPEGPGLGVELDPESMARWHQHFVG